MTDALIRSEPSNHTVLLPSFRSTECESTLCRYEELLEEHNLAIEKLETVLFMNSELEAVLASSHGQPLGDHGTRTIGSPRVRSTTRGASAARGAGTGGGNGGAAAQISSPALSPARRKAERAGALRKKCEALAASIAGVIHSRTEGANEQGLPLTCRCLVDALLP